MANTKTFEWLARIGYGSRGIVFLLIAGLALLSGVGGEGPDTNSALTTVLQQPFGRVWLGLIGAGILGFVAWRFVQAIFNADGQEDDLKGYVTRAALLTSAATYIGLATFALSQAFSFGNGGGSGGERGLAEWAMSQPFGRYLAGLIGIGFIIGGAVTIFKGVMQKFRRYMRLPHDRKSPIALICVYGLASRGLVFAIVGVFFVYAGVTVDPQQAGNMADAFTWIRTLPFGAALYVVVALGLAAFGLYNLVEARYRTIRTPDIGEMKRSLPI
jgi:hypothetical protein